ncbi:protein-L-isoaspartate(D-aspartate) O-methyltransferase [Prosthecomicrobium sp. N25]|uniref:protein-L-isoaspartate(D-aspartate) O-methyltransferase n=1 Tax=Prosthecomicrobium sp. N25 TaxID=3129254 RepID=UPI00307766F6
MAGRERERREMVERQLVGRGIRDPGVLEVFRAVPREAFVPAAMAEAAYRDGPLEIGEGQTISQPFVVALMMESARIGPRDSLLEVGAGSGYAAAIASRLAGRVVSIERIPSLAAVARANLSAAGIEGVTIVEGDGSTPPGAEAFDVILVAAAGPRVPEALAARLAPGGRLVMPVGPGRDEQVLLRVTRQGDGRLLEEAIDRVSFVPLIGREAWPER